MILPIVLLSCIHVVSRSSLNVIDRFVFSQSKMSFLRLYFFTNLCPLLLGFLLLPFFEHQTPLWAYFLTWPCALLALATHLVGMSFSYAFRHSEVREVIIKAKIPELFFAFASVFPILSNRFSLFSFGTGTYITIISTLIGLVFIGSAKKMKISSFFDRAGLCIIGSLMMQMLCASCHLISTKTWQDAIPLSIAMLLWRCCLTLPLLFIHNRRGNKNSQVEVGGSSEAVLQARGALFATLRLLSTRAAFALATQFTFAWCVLEGPSYVIWPIFNTTPLVASIASQFILKERPHWSEIAALLCFFSGSTCMVFL